MLDPDSPPKRRARGWKFCCGLAWSSLVRGWELSQVLGRSQREASMSPRDPFSPRGLGLFTKVSPDAFQPRHTIYLCLQTLNHSKKQEPESDFLID